ncbi:helix-turn-helix domain-containing protein [Clostridioides sp. ES-S-0123-01]|uniref:helix-turn-helix domain-containing protein n=1 Tax=Clostridioides sp. ES-S-0123-01 TaxID=2770783 RepID=UPI001D12D1DA|nr:helix-turn-helix domain-containing protein [Clostridioides sp. ES-S-0123-01]
MIKKCNVRKTYSVEYKLLAVKGHIEDGVSYRRLAEEFKIHEQMIIKWCKKYRELGIDALEEQRGSCKGSSKGRPRTKELSKMMKYLNLKQKMNI